MQQDKASVANQVEVLILFLTHDLRINYYGKYYGSGVIQICSNMSNKKGSAGASSRRTKVQTHYTTQARTEACPAKLTERSGDGAALPNAQSVQVTSESVDYIFANYCAAFL